MKDRAYGMWCEEFDNCLRELIELDLVYWNRIRNDAGKPNHTRIDDRKIYDEYWTKRNKMVDNLHTHVYNWTSKGFLNS